MVVGVNVAGGVAVAVGVAAAASGCGAAASGTAGAFNSNAAVTPSATKTTTATIANRPKINFCEVCTRIYPYRFNIRIIRDKELKFNGLPNLHKRQTLMLLALYVYIGYNYLSENRRFCPVFKVARLNSRRQPWGSI